MTNTKIDDQQARSWAQESTLSELAGLQSTNNQILLKVAGKLGAETDGIKAAGREAKKTADDLEYLGKGTKDYTRSVNELKYSMQRASSTMGGLITGSQEPLKMIPEMMKGFGGMLGGVFSKLGGNGKLASIAIEGLAGASGVLFARFLDGAETYRDMIQNGVMFNGSIEGMIDTVRSSGTSLKMASQIAQKDSTMLLINGPKNFFGTVGKMGGTFAKFGMTMDQGAESLADLMDMQRLSGALYSNSQEELATANEHMLGLLNQQARLTGVSVKRQLEEQKKVAEQANLQVLLSAKGPQARMEAQSVETKLLAEGFSGEEVTGLITEMLGGPMGKATARLRRLYGPAIEQTISGGAQAFAGGGEELLDQARDTLAKALPVAIARAQTSAFASGAGVDIRNKEDLDSIARMYRASGPSTQGTNAQAVKTDADRAQDANAGLTASTLNLFNATNDLTQAMGKTEGMIAKTLASTGAIDGLTSSLGYLAKNANALTDSLRTWDGSMEGLLKKIKDASIGYIKEHPAEVAEGVAVGGGALLAKRALNKRTEAAAAKKAADLSAKAHADALAKGLTPEAAELAAKKAALEAAKKPGFFARTAKGLSKGIGGLLGGAVLDYGADYLGRDTRAGALADTGSKALTYSAYGAMVPVLGETGISEALGALIGTAQGLYENWDAIIGKSKETTLPTPPKPEEPEDEKADEAPSTSENDPTMIVLNNILTQMTAVATNTGTLLNEFTQANSAVLESDQNNHRNLIKAIYNQG
jgi:hypothetical protein